MGTASSWATWNRADQELHMESLAKMLGAVTQKLDAHGIRHIIGYGTLLGLYRDKALLWGDNDVDICIDGTSLTLEYVNDIKNEYSNAMSSMFYSHEEISTLLKDGGVAPIKSMRVSPRDENGKKLCKTAFVDLYMFFPYANAQYLRYGTQSYVRCRTSTFDTKRFATSMGEFNIPKNTEQFLEDEYGWDWNVPQLGKIDRTYGFKRARIKEVGDLYWNFTTNEFDSAKFG